MWLFSWLSDMIALWTGRWSTMGSSFGSFRRWSSTGAPRACLQDHDRKGSTMEETRTREDALRGLCRTNGHSESGFNALRPSTISIQTLIDLAHSTILYHARLTSHSPNSSF